MIIVGLIMVDSLPSWKQVVDKFGDKLVWEVGSGDCAFVRILAYLTEGGNGPRIGFAQVGYHGV